MTELDRESYLKAKIEREKALLGLEGETERGGGKVYCLTRDLVARLAESRVDKLIAKEKQPKVLEIGCGKGVAVKKLLSDHEGLEASSITATSLTRLEEHSELEEMGVTVKTEILAEFLPGEWTNTFDVVLASAVMQWSDTGLSVPQVERVLKKKGFFIGFDTRVEVGKIETLGEKLGMRDVLGKKERDHWEKIGRKIVPFVLQKK